MSAMADLEPIGLAEVERAAALQTRVDRKYLVPEALVDDLLAEAIPGARVLVVDGRAEHDYASVYFDTADLAAYRGAAGRRRRRFKVRTRSYLDSGTTVLEVKTRGGRGETVKRRTAHAAHPTRLDGAARAFVRAELGDLLPEQPLVPTLATRYRRTTVVDPRVPMRMTIDTGLRCVDLAGEPAGHGGAHDNSGRDQVALADRAIVEIKSGGRPTPADRWLWAHGHRPIAMSKYAVGVAALRGLPGNHWRRALHALD